MAPRCFVPNTERGQAALLTVVLILLAMLILIGLAAALALRGANIAELSLKSARSYFLAESGLEDGAYRLLRGKNTPASYTLSLFGATTTITVSDVSGAKEILSSADLLKARRAQKAVLKNTSGVSFYYGVQVGAGGLAMGNNTKIIGNVFSNGPIAGGGVNNNSVITGNAQAAGASLIKDIRVNNGASAGSFNNCIIDGQAKYFTSFTNCTASSTSVLAAPLAPQPFPIAQSQIDAWKSDAAAGGTLNVYTLGNNASASLGPKKINGNINLGNNSTLTLSGTVWVTGTINFGNSDILKLAPSYGSLSGVLIVDGAVDIGNTVILQGSGQTGSYLMLLSTFGPGDAIGVGNDATAAIFYAPNGILDIGNSLSLREATGYGLRVGNNSTITYETGLANLNFSSGPSGGWNIDSWQEIIPP